MLRRWEAPAQLTCDVVLFSGLIYLTGGVVNPFVLILIGPVSLAAASLPLRSLLVVGGAAVGAILCLTFYSLPLTVPGPMALAVPPWFPPFAALANMLGIILIPAGIYLSAAESARLALALNVARSVLAREQQLSALGILAAAAAHELGTPLATIAVVAKEMAREAATPQVREDADLLVIQAARCREILRRLTEAPDAATDAVQAQMTLRQLVDEVVAIHPGSQEVTVQAIVTGVTGVLGPDIWRLPQILHALNSLVENAVDFAGSKVLVTARFDAASISLEVRDDGPGFSADVLPRLGEPYISARPAPDRSRSGHMGLGLGLFIAKILLEQTGAQVTFRNSRPNGAVVTAHWPRALIEVPRGYSQHSETAARHDAAGFD